MLHLIGNSISTCTKRVLMTLNELNLDGKFTIYQPDILALEQKQPAHTAKQPFGVVPVLEDGEFRIYESRAICRYLALKYGEGRLIPDPKDLKATALFEQWASVELTNYDTYATVLVAQTLFNKLRGIEPIPAVVDFEKKHLSDKLDIYDKILANQSYMGGDEFSVIDIFYMPYTGKLFEAGEGALIESRPNVKAWWTRVSSRASWKHDIDPEASQHWASMVAKLG